MFDDEWQVSLSYCKSELLVTVGFLVCAGTFFEIVMTTSVFFISNQNQLPVNFHVIFLPIEGTSYGWGLNYIYQVVDKAFAGAFVCAYAPLSLILMNHCCWGIDVVILLVTKLDESLLDEAIETKELKRILINKRLKKIIEMTYSVLEWQGEVQNLLQFNFLLEFSLLSFIFCMCLYTMTSNQFHQFHQFTFCCQWLSFYLNSSLTALWVTELYHGSRSWLLLCMIPDGT